jgi:hypothetical protein
MNKQGIIYLPAGKFTSIMKRGEAGEKGRHKVEE